MKNKPDTSEINPNQSIPLLKALHILTNDGKLNQDSRRKLKQVNHLVNFIAPLLADISEPNIVDIKDRFYSLVHKYEHQNNSGAIIVTTIVLHIDDSANVVYSSIVR